MPLVCLTGMSTAHHWMISALSRADVPSVAGELEGNVFEWIFVDPHQAPALWRHHHQADVRETETEGALVRGGGEPPGRGQGVFQWQLTL